MASHLSPVLSLLVRLCLSVLCCVNFSYSPSHYLEDVFQCFGVWGLLLGWFYVGFLNTSPGIGVLEDWIILLNNFTLVTRWSASIPKVGVVYV